ncbi:MAG: methionine--tRNA ligase [Tissierellia bacterium]|nr:methionine--tRNA ligase [Tissierellia bacterium]
MKEKFYLTTPIYYPNGNLHIGHTYCTIAADTIKRFKNYQGYDAYFTTGTDEHGQKIAQTAADFGMKPLEYVDRIVEDTKELWKLLDIEYDSFIRSTDPQHEKNVQNIFQTLYDKGEIYKGEYEGFYCTPCESFWTESQMDEEHNCPDCGRPTHKAKESTYFFKLSEYTDKLLDYYKTHPDFIKPKSREREMINNFLKDGLEDLSVSRSSVEWGVPVPFDEEHVIYVWIDALSCYLSAIGYGFDEEKFNAYWPAGVHLVGKEIVRFHVIIWPALLMAMDLPLPKQIFGHGWILFDDDKMSKSKGNIQYPEPIVNLYGVDALRYFLLKEFTFGEDGSFTVDKFLKRMNSDLANDLGNLLSRTVSMIEKYTDGEIPSPSDAIGPDEDLKELLLGTKAKVEEAMEEWQFSDALESIWQAVRRTNKYVDETEPWIICKDEDQTRIKTVLYNLAESLRIISVLLYPFMKETALKLREQLGLCENPSFEEADTWGLLEIGTKVEKKAPIFPRVDIEKERERLAKANDDLNEERMEKLGGSKKLVDKHTKPEITIDDFGKLEIRVAKVESVEDHPNADRLYLLNLKMGCEKKTIVSSIKDFYKPEDLVGKNIVIVNNLKPHNFRGIESAGMLLAAEDEDGKLSLLTTMEEIADGSCVY